MPAKIGRLPIHGGRVIRYVKDRALAKIVLMRGQKISFYGEIWKIIPKLSLLSLLFLSARHSLLFVRGSSGGTGHKGLITVIILNIGTDRSEQTVQTQIRLLLMEQSDQDLLCLLFCLHLLNTLLHCKIQLFQL